MPLIAFKITKAFKTLKLKHTQNTFDVHSGITRIHVCGEGVYEFQKKSLLIIKP